MEYVTRGSDELRRSINAFFVFGPTGHFMMNIISRKAGWAASWWILITSASAQYNSSQPRAKSGFEYVDSLIGTINGGL
jgi:hypothetical protein